MISLHDISDATVYKSAVVVSLYGGSATAFLCNCREDAEFLAEDINDCVATCNAKLFNVVMSTMKRYYDVREIPVTQILKLS